MNDWLGELLSSAQLTMLQQQFNQPLTVLLVTLGAYLLAEKVFIRCGRKGWLHPLFTATILTFLLIKLTPLSYAAYTEHSGLLKMLLAPFTVALAIPLSKQISTLRKEVSPLLFGVITGGLVAVLAGIGIAQLSGATKAVVISVASKAVTTAVAVVMAEQYHAIIPLVTAVVVICGVYGSLIAPSLCQRFGITDPRAIGFTMGVNAHAGGTARGFEIDTTIGVYASLGMCLCAIYMPFLVPWLLQLLGFLT